VRKNTLDLPEAEKTTEKSNEISTIELVKSFMKILTNSSADVNKNNFKYMSQIWALTLRSLSIVDAEDLVREKIFDGFIEAFLTSSTEI